MTRFTIRFWFCLAVATIAAAIADPMVEYASNAGWFGPGRFTDHSNGDVIPALLAGLLLVGIFAALKVRADIGGAKTNVFRAFDRACGPALVGLLPFAYALQLIALYVMESCEQMVLWGHLGSATLWLGAPVIVSLSVHAIICVAVAFAAAKLVNLFGATTLRVIRLIRSLACSARLVPQVPAKRTLGTVTFERLVLANRGIGERAPPFSLA